MQLAHARFYRRRMGFVANISMVNLNKDIVVILTSISEIRREKAVVEFLVVCFW